MNNPNGNDYFVAGGAGYIGKTVVHALTASEPCNVCVYDDLSTGTPDGIQNLEVGDLRTVEPSHQLIPSGINGFTNPRQLTVMMFAGYKSVEESVTNPLKYYHNNVGGLLRLLSWMKYRGSYNLVFSSSATVYGDPQYLPLTEKHPLSAVNPYGWTKLMCERILMGLAASDPRWRIGILRYFNPVGAWPERGHGETPQSPPPNLMPFMAQVATGKREKLLVYGSDYPTVDGTGVRDYLHVRDLAEAHLLTSEYLRTTDRPLTALNLGVGRGFSVLEVMRAFEQVSGRAIAYEVVGRRAGDIGASYCDPTKARELLGWTARRTLVEMCDSEWRWQMRQ